MKQLIKNTLIWVSLPLLAGCNCFNKDEQAASQTAITFLNHLFSCELQRAEDLTTPKGRQEMLWFTSNLTEDDLAHITSYPNIKATNADMTDSTVTITYHASNVIVCDSLQKKGHIGERDGKVILRQEGDKWLVDSLEW